MDTDTTLLAVLAALLAVVTWLAHRQGNERRDVGLLAAIAGLLVTGTAASTMF